MLIIFGRLALGQAKVKRKLPSIYFEKHTNEYEKSNFKNISVDFFNLISYKASNQKKAPSNTMLGLNFIFFKKISHKKASDYSFIKNIILPATGKIKHIKLCKESSNSIAYVINGKYIIRFPRSYKSFNKMMKEEKILALLQGKVTANIPNVKHFKNKYDFFIHERIEGVFITEKKLKKLTPSEKESFCHDIASFINEIHGVTGKVKSCLVPTLPRYKYFKNPFLTKKILCRSDYFSREEKKEIITFCDMFREEKRGSRVFSHLDILSQNIAFDPVKKKINGFFDFGECAITNIYYDFFRLSLNYDDNMMRCIIKRYNQISGHTIVFEKVKRYTVMYYLNFSAKKILRHNFKPEFVLKLRKNCPFLKKTLYKN